MIELRDDVRPLFGALAFEDWFRLEGRPAKVAANGRRRTIELERGGRRFYLKTHEPVGWGEVLKCLASGKRPILGARAEVEALEAARDLGLPAPRLAGWGVAGRGPAGQRSFVLTDALEVQARASDLRLPDLAPARRRRLTRALGHAVGSLHRAGWVHQDLYLEHVLLVAGTAEGLALVDLHRTLRPRLRGERGRVKDLAALLDSARRGGATRADELAFLSAYAGRPPRDARRELATRLARVTRRSLSGKRA